jgi:hypothetical protein
MAMGFCLFNNIAIGAAHACAVHGLKRVAIVDFDVHHGNGTQHMFEHDAQIFLRLDHQMPLYPGTGARSERGVGNICNAPLPAFRGRRRVPRAYEEIDAAGDRPASAGADHDLRRVRCAPRRPAGQPGAGGGGFRLGHRALGELAATHCRRPPGFDP